MADKLAELRQRFRGYQPVKVDESDDEFDETNDTAIEMTSMSTSARQNSDNFRAAYRSIQSSGGKKKSNLCKLNRPV